MGGTTPTLALPGFYFDLAIQTGIWVMVAIVIIVIPWTLQNRLSPFSRTGAWSTWTTTTEVSGRGFLRMALGCMWVLDGALQAQPAMAGNFATQVIAPLNNSQPSWLQDLLRWEVYLWQDHAVVFDVATVLIQIGLGISILAGKDTVAGRIGLWMSIGWALAVWVGGEAFGGLFVVGASELFGAPGPVLAYAAAAALLLLPVRAWDNGKANKIIRSGLGVVLLVGALLQMVPFEGFWYSHRLSSMFSAMAATPQPGFLSAPIASISRSVAARPDLWNVGAIVVMAILGIGLLAGRARRAWSWATALWLFAIWWFSQDFGFLGGVGTDPNLNIPLLILLIAGENVGVKKFIYRWATLVGSRLNLRNLVPTTAFIKFTKISLQSGVAFSGLAAVAVGVVPVLLVTPSALERPVSLHISPPPLATGLIIPLGTLTGQINVFVQASKGRVEVTLQAPSLDPTSNSSPAQDFQLWGRLKTASQRTERLNWLRCGQGCFVTNASWSTGENRLFIDDRDKGFTGGSATFDVPWPPKPNNTIIPKVVAAMRSVKSVKVQQAISSNTLEPYWTSSGTTSGARVLSNEPFGSGKSVENAVLLSHTDTTTEIAFDYPAEYIYIKMTIGSNDRIISEDLAAPQHLIKAKFGYSG